MASPHLNMRGRLALWGFTQRIQWGFVRSIMAGGGPPGESLLGGGAEFPVLNGCRRF